MKFNFPWKKEPAPATDVAGDESRVSKRSVKTNEPILFEGADIVVEANVTLESEWIWRPLLVVTVCGVILALMLSALREYRGWINQPIETVAVEGATRHISKHAVASQVAGSIDARLLDLDLQQIQERLLEEPWINDAHVTRTWPPALRIDLVEEVPVARWGTRGLLNHQGDIFWPERLQEYQTLPVLTGPSHETVRVMQQFRDLNSLFIRSGIQLAGLELEPRGAWTLKLNNGVKVVAGRDDLMPRLRRFIQVYEAQLMSRAEEIDEVDIRYTNGVAVKWKKSSGNGAKAS